MAHWEVEVANPAGLVAYRTTVEADSKAQAEAKVRRTSTTAKFSTFTATKKSATTADRRARLHRALDAVMDTSGKFPCYCGPKHLTGAGNACVGKDEASGGKPTTAPVSKHLTERPRGRTRDGFDPTKAQREREDKELLPVRIGGGKFGDPLPQHAGVKIPKPPARDAQPFETNYKGFRLKHLTGSVHGTVVVIDSDGKKVYTAKNAEAAKKYADAKAY